jgi:hypothetical protein
MQYIMYTRKHPHLKPLALDFEEVPALLGFSCDNHCHTVPLHCEYCCFFHLTRSCRLLPDGDDLLCESEPLLGGSDRQIGRFDILLEQVKW